MGMLRNSLKLDAGFGADELERKMKIAWVRKSLLKTMLLASFSVPFGGASAAEEILSFGVVPQQSATRLAAIWVPYMRALSEVSGFKFKFFTAKDIPTFEACLVKGAYDVAYMNPYHYTVYHERSGYRAFARQKDKKLKGLLVARVDSSINDIEDLDANIVAFPSPAAFGASVIPRAEMKSGGIQFFPKYVKSHDSVYRAVSAGLIPAGGGVLRTFNTVPEDIRAKLKVIYKTEGYTPHAFAAHPKLSVSVVTSIQEAMLEMNFSHAKLLKPLGMKGIEIGVDADWDDVRKLNLTSSDTNIVEGDRLPCHSG